MDTTEVVMLDSNIPMYAVGREHPYKLPCQEILRHAAAGDLNAVTNTEVHQEILHRYLAQGMGAKARGVSERFQTAVPAVLPVSLREIERSRDLCANYPELPARDLVHVAVMLSHGIRVIISADRHFDQVSEVTRLDPLGLARTGKA